MYNGASFTIGAVMIYAYSPSPTRTIVAAALNRATFEQWFLNVSDEHFTTKMETDIWDHMADSHLELFRTTVFVFDHADSAQRQAFVDQHQLMMCTRERAADRHTDMLNWDAPDPYSPEDNRTIAEIYNLVEHDRFDQRTDEQKAQDLEIKKMMDDLRKKGEVSEDSFAPLPEAGDDAMRVSDVRVKQKQDGSQEIDNILASKENQVEIVDNATLVLKVNDKTLISSVQWKGSTLYGSRDTVDDIWERKLYGDVKSFSGTVTTLDGTQTSEVLFNEVITNIYSKEDFKEEFKQDGDGDLKEERTE